MRRYIVLYSAPKPVAERFAQATPEEAQQGLQLWVDWQKKLGTSLIDPGKPLGNAMKVTKAGITSSDTKVIGIDVIEEVPILELQ